MITINRKEEVELFAYLSRQTKLREWLQAHLDTEIQVLVLNGDIEVVRKAQGKAQLLQKMLDLLDKAPAALER